MNATEAKNLLERYNQDLCTDEERLLVEQWENELLSSGKVAGYPKNSDYWREFVHQQLMKLLDE